MSILASLAKAYDRLERESALPPFGYAPIKIGFVVGLNTDGTVAAIAPRGEPDGKRKSIPALLVPQPAKKSVNISPNFLWGNSSYVFGVTGDENKATNKAKRLGDEHASFVRYHLDVLRKADDPGLTALTLFLSGWSPDLFVPPSWPQELLDQNIAFALESERIQNVYLHDRPAAKAIWERLSLDAKGSAAICLVTGEMASVARLHQRIKGIRSSGGKEADSIVSFNAKAYESYGHTQGDNASVSELAAFKYTTALNTFLAGRTNRLQVGDASTVFWADAADAESASAAESVFGGLFQNIDETVEAGKVGAILKRIRSGTVWQDAVHEVVPVLEPGVRFHVLGLSPNAARISVRFWFEDDFGALAAHYQRFVADMAIVPPPRDGYPPLWRYLNETAVRGKRENVQPNLAGEWIRAILAGTPYPLTLLNAVLTRIRADGDVNELRAGMLRALLVRNYGMGIGKQRDKSKEAPVSLDPDNRNKGYLLGRLFAAYEQAQTAALGRNVNATIKDKFYGSASATPRRVFALLEKGSANHLSKVGKQRPGQRVNLERTIGSILDAMAPGEDPFPASLPAEDQALFGLGYYHQRSEFFRKPEAATEEEPTS